jgi:vancomycin resistance protein VanJ
LLYLAETFLAEHYWLSTLALYAPQVIFSLPALALIVWSALRKDRRMLALNAAALVVFVLTLSDFNIPLRRDDGRNGTNIRIMTFNLRQGAKGILRAADVIRRSHPDILCVQEVLPWDRWGDPVWQLQQLIPAYHVERDGELATFSRYPIISHKVHYLGLNTGRAVFEITTVIQGRKLTVLNTHFNVFQGVQSVTNRPIGLREYACDSATLRSAQMTKLLRIAAGASRPFVIACDLNTPPRGLIYRRIARVYSDAFRLAGWGTGYTFRADLPVWRIDYVFLTSRIGALRCFVPAARASDHRPLVADIVLR